MSDNLFYQPNDLPEEENPENLSVDELIASAKADLFEAEQGPLPEDAISILPEEPMEMDSTRVVSKIDAETGMPLLDTSESELNYVREENPVLIAQSAEIDFEPDFGNTFDDYGDYGEPEEPEEEPMEEELPKKEKSKRRRIPTLVRVILYFAITIAVGIGLGLFGWECAQDVLALGQEDRETSVSILAEDSIDDIADKLYAKGLIRHRWLFKIYCDVSNADEKIDPGVYKLNYRYDYHALVNGMIEYAPNRETVTVMITEGYNAEQIFALLEKNKVCSAEALREVAQNGSFDYWFLEGTPAGTNNRLEGFLYPDTYEFYISDTAENVLDKMLDNFEDRISDYEEEIKQSGYTVRDIINVAAMIEEEAADDKERDTMASVLFNRLKSDDYLQYLQMDSTVFYACDQAGKGFDITFDSLYNTYVYPGLPYGPISNPGLPSIKAALRPAETDYYYFAAGKDGVSHFFKDFDSFNAFITSDEYLLFTEKDG